MKERYISLMAKTLTAYSDEHIHEYFDRVKREGLTEHGFPRLTANLGILIAHGRRRDLLPLFLEMMDFCCATIPTCKAANDFSVREIICCLWEIERNAVVAREITERWRDELAGIAHQHLHHLEFFVGQGDMLRAAGKVKGLPVQREITQCQHIRSEHFSTPAGHCPDPGQKLFGHKGFC